MTDEELLKLAYQVCCQTSKVQPYNSEMSWTAYRVWRELFDRFEERSQSVVKTHTANTENWIEATRGLKIVAHVQDNVPTISVSSKSLSTKVAESLERSLTEHANVWAELARY